MILKGADMWVHPFSLRRQLNLMWQIRCSYLWHTAVKRMSCYSFFVKSKSGRSIVRTSLCGLSEMTSAFLLTALCFSKNAALNRVLSNDTVKGLALITLETPLDGLLSKLKAADHLQGSPGIALPPRHKNTHWLHTNPQTNPSWVTCFLQTQCH